MEGIITEYESPERQAKKERDLNQVENHHNS